VLVEMEDEVDEVVEPATSQYRTLALICGTPLPTSRVSTTGPKPSCRLARLIALKPP
jgi:hypothetical protein